ncbi:MAG: hydroxyethylthiazole kinase [Pseudomonadota bacterium]
MISSDSIMLDKAVDAILALRESGSHIQSITNTVAQNFTANVLLACGATVSMTANPEEMEGFMGRADALHINLGTLDGARINAIDKSVRIAIEREIPVTLDPVKINRSAERKKVAQSLIQNVQIIRGNELEINVLEIAPTANQCLVETGTKDQITSGDRGVQVHNGHPLMAKVIATGCAMGGLIAALSAKTNDPFVAGLAGALWFSIAGENAAGKATGPGTFQPIFLDELYSISIDQLKNQARISK